MIFGKTTATKREAREEWTQRFAFVPVRLWDGRLIWWETYFARVSCGCPYDGPGAFLGPVTQRLLKIPKEGDPEWRGQWRDLPPPSFK